MSQAPPPEREERAAGAEAISVVSAYGAFRVLLVVLAIWTFFAGFSLLTQGVGALSFGGDDKAAERIIGAQMLVLVPVYGLLAWRREQYRYLIWIPYAAQLAIVIPGAWDLFIGEHELDGALLYVISLIFLVLLVYLWSSSHPIGFFAPEEEEQPEEGEEYEEESLEGDEAATDESARTRRYRRTT